MVKLWGIQRIGFAQILSWSLVFWCGLDLWADDAKKLNQSAAKSPSMQLLLSMETPFTTDLKKLSELIVEPRLQNHWKSQGVVPHIFPSLIGKRRGQQLPKYFFVNLFNPFAPKKCGFVDPLAPYSGLRPGRKGAFDVKTADMQGVLLLGRSR
ncbi:MAG: hypothetical protein M2R45_04221 [Verrucomicrobia subdivision 3 bacterium]|nr:hypothetical protein [Limisphaerales bacterium]MCS1417042.1 hypothetical protein [Limisphaerales bacterium]